MNKKEYLNNLLTLCTEKQCNFFSRIYPNGPKPNQIKHAISQTENTLRNLNATNEDLKRVKKEAKESIDEFTIKNNIINQNLKNTENELKEAYALIERLKTPISVNNNDIQEQLDLLSALEAGGVDNWEFYDESISNYRRG